MTTTYLKMQQLFDGTAATIFATMVEVLQEFGVDTRKVMGFGSDVTLVMVGNPHSVPIHCCCHRPHLSVSNVCQEMPDIH